MGDKMNTKLQNGMTMPLLGFGTWQLTDTKCINAIEIALKKGYKHIDTAEAYGNESEIGKVLKNFNREDLFITSKLWISHYKYDDAIKACDESLSKLGTDYLDLYLMHWPDGSQDIEETIKAMKELYDTKKIKAFGVSNFTIKHLEKAIPIAEKIGIPITVNQVEFHPGLYQKELMDFCKENKIVLEAYSPLARGKVSDNDVLSNIASKYNKTPAQITLRWILDKDIVVIPKASSEEHIVDNMDVFDFALDDVDIESINNMGNSERLVVPEFAEFD